MKKIAVLTGAGMSVESGFSTFRDAGGLWEKHPVEKVATPEGWLADSGLVTDFYNKLRRQLIGAQPNKGHLLLAKLEEFFDVTIITQNVENLHEKAGSNKVIHLHGELMKVTSSKQPNNPKYIRVLDPDNPDVILGDKAQDGSLLRPFIVWFGEAVPKMEEAVEAVCEADIFVIIGTSLNVYPAAGLLNYVAHNVPVYLIDPQKVNVASSRSIHFITKGASAGMEELFVLLTNG